jgi:hypothetical protein
MLWLHWWNMIWLRREFIETHSLVSCGKGMGFVLNAAGNSSRALSTLGQVKPSMVLDVLRPKRQ